MRERPHQPGPAGEPQPAADTGLASQALAVLPRRDLAMLPADATFAVPPSATWESAVLTAARQAHRAALAAAVRHAVAAEALRVIEAELLATRHRLRAVRDRWIPGLEQALAEVTLALEEQERSDAARLRLSLAGRLRG